MNWIFWSSEPDDEQRDRTVGSWLSQVDPGRDDATYWMRFHKDVLDNARFELARRRREAALTVSGVVSSWSRALVPAALVAAAAAGIMLAQPSVDETEQAMLIEEVLSLGMEEPLPVMFAEDEDDDPLLLAAELY